MHPRLNRREFLAAATASATALVGAGCATVSREDQPLVIDTHTHFYDPTRPQGVPWPPPNDAVLYRTVLPANYRALPTPQPVTGTVVVEASPRLEDNQWILDLAAREPFIVGFVGNLPVGTPEFAAHLTRFAANPLFRGIRIRDRKLTGAFEEALFLSDLKLLAARNLSLDLVGGLEILTFAQRLAKAIPDLRIVIDHLAGVRIDGQAPPVNWIEAMRSLASCRNVNLKVSGLVEGTGRRGGQAPREVDFYRPVLDAIWHLFGPDRLIYGSNWPVCEHFASLATVQGIVMDYFTAKGNSALDAVFERNAKRVYLPRCPQSA